MYRTVPLFALLLALAPVAEAQLGGLGGRIRDRVSRDAERRIEERAVEAARRTLDLAEDAIVCAVSDTDCIEGARQSGREPVVVDEDGAPVSGYEPPSTDTGGGDPTAGGTGAAPGPGDVWDTYEFVPGERVLFVHDFEGTPVGNFPSRLDYIAGGLDVVRVGAGDAANLVLRVGEGTTEGGSGGNGCFSIPLPETLPERFTMEFRAMTSDPLGRDRIQLFSNGADDSPDTRCTYPPPNHVIVGTGTQGLKWRGAEAVSNAGYGPNDWATVALGCDGDYCKMFVDGTRVANVPRYDFPRAGALHVFLNVYRHGLFLDDIRIAEGGNRSLYDDLEAAGELSTTAIRFDTGSATLRPESGGYLAQIVSMLDAHPDLALEIQGHTDTDGTEADNQDLSERRADAVAAYLAARGVARDRLTTVGFGESQPAAPNDTAEGKAQNRRVVFKRVQG